MPEPNTTPNPNDSSPTTPEPNPIVNMKAQDLFNENIRLNNELKAALEKLKRTEDLLAQANDIIKSDMRSRKIDSITRVSNYTVEDLDKMSLDELDQIERTLQMAKKHFAPVVSVGDSDEKPAGLDGIYEAERKKWVERM